MNKSSIFWSNATGISFLECRLSVDLRVMVVRTDRHLCSRRDRSRFLHAGPASDGRKQPAALSEDEERRISALLDENNQKDE